MAVRTPIREEHRALTRTRVLEAAARVFARRGFHGASVQDIAREAGATTGAIYSNFAGKEDLYLAVFEEHVATQIRDYTDTFARGRDLDERSRGGADHWMARLREDPDFFPLYMEFWAHAMRDPKLRPRFAAHFASFRETFAQLIEQGNGLALERLTDPDAVPDELLGWAISLLFNLLLMAARSGDVGELERLMEGLST